MGWFDGIWNRNDPLREIDPSLREFLQKEAPKQYKTSAEASKSGEVQSYREQLGLKHNDPEEQQRRKEGPKDESSVSEDKPLPAESLYPDGRYKHLWQNYRSQAEVEDAGKSDQERLLDIVAGYKERQAEVGRAALENCSNEQWAVHECFRSGSWSALATMCRTENKELSRCILMQSKFLRALGYVSMYDRPQEETERIQMHADRLYHRMLDQEKQMEDAKARGEQVELPPLMREYKDGELAGSSEPDVVVPKPGPMTWETLPEKAKENIAKQRFAGLEGPALELAKRELEQDIAVNREFVVRLNERYMTERRERLQRLAEGNERLSDKIKRWFDFRDYKDDEEGKS